MKRNRLLLILFLAFTAGSLAAYINASRDKRKDAQQVAPAVKMTNIVVAAHVLPIGTLLSPRELKLVSWPESSVPSGALRSTEQALSRGVITPIFAGEPIMEERLAPKEAGGGVAVAIPEGMRALSVKVDEVIGVAGFVRPSTRVDVLATISESEDEGASSHLILQNIQVLAAGREVQDKPKEGEEAKAAPVTVITLLVSPPDAEKLVLASTRGKIQLALRNPLDISQEETSGARMGTLTSSVPSTPLPGVVSRPYAPLPPVKAFVPAPQAGVQVESFNGSKKSTSQFDDSQK